MEAGTYDLANYNLGHGGRGQVQIDFDVRLIGVGGMVKLTSSNLVEKGFLKTQPGVSLYVENFEFFGADSGSNNGAGIRHQGQDLTVVNSFFHDNEQGILSTGSPTGTIYLSGIEFARNGFQDGRSHGIYINQADNLVVVDSNFYDQVVGHHIKSLAASNTWVVNTILDDAGGTSSYAIDVTLGGNLYVTGSTITQDATSQNPSIINYTTARGGIPGVVIIDNNTITDNHGNGNFIRNTTDAITQIYNNQFFEGPGASLNITGISDQFSNSLNGSPLPDMDHLFGATAGTAGNDSIVGTNAGNKIAGYGGHDVLTGGPNIAMGNDTLYGGDGNDSLYGGNGNDYLSGGAGNDYIQSGNHDDTLAGNDGDDVLVSLTTSKNVIYGGDGNDILYGGSWKDELNGGAGFDIAIYDNKGSDYVIKYDPIGKITVQANGGSGGGEGEGGEGEGGTGESGTDNVISVEAFQFSDGVYWTETFVWQAGAVIVDASSVLAGQPFGRLYEGTDSNDVLSGGSGGDTLVGFKGNDSLSGQAGVDIIYGGVGQDTLKGGTELDVLYGGVGSDWLLGGSGSDYIEGNDGNDSITGGTFSDTLKGGNGNDTIEGNAGHDIIERHNGDDLLIGGTGNDTMYGLNGTDHMSGDAGNDVIFGEQGNDTLIGGLDSDILDGGDDGDLYLWSNGDGRDQIVDSGSSGSDVIRTSDTSFKGLGTSLNGIEKIEHDSNATFYVIGGNGDDNWNFTSVDLTTARFINTGEGNDTVDGTANNDDIRGGLGADLLIGRSGDDTISGGAGADLLIGMSNHDSVDGGGGNDHIFLGFGMDTAIGGAGNDTIEGLNGADHIAGNGGNDVIRGEQGTDTLIGGDGNDFLLGGTESDLFSFDGDDGADTINDFEIGIDLIEITGGMSFTDVLLTQAGSDLDISFSTTTVRLLGVDQNDVDSGDFLFN